MAMLVGLFPEGADQINFYETGSAAGNLIHRFNIRINTTNYDRISSLSVKKPTR